jgi:hypothetical protein
MSGKERTEGFVEHDVAFWPVRLEEVAVVSSMAERSDGVYKMRQNWYETMMRLMG